MKARIPSIIPSLAPETGDPALDRMLHPACFFEDPRGLPRRRHSGAAQRNPESRVVTVAEMRGAPAPAPGAGALDSGFRCAAPE